MKIKSKRHVLISLIWLASLTGGFGFGTADNGYDIQASGNGCMDNQPVHSVSWCDVLKWCHAKSEMEGLMPVYTVDDVIFKIGSPEYHYMLTWNETANGYRLPSLYEWQYAARGGVNNDPYLSVIIILLTGILL